MIEEWADKLRFVYLVILAAVIFLFRFHACNRCLLEQIVGGEFVRLDFLWCFCASNLNRFYDVLSIYRVVDIKPVVFDDDSMPIAVR